MTITSKIIEKDLNTGFTQINQPPDSFDCGNIEDGTWRHYELGQCFGLVCFDQPYKDITHPENKELKHNILVMPLGEDDGTWFLIDKPSSCSAGWCLHRGFIYEKMYNWCIKNCTRQYMHGFEGQAGYECGFNERKIN